MSKVYVAVMGIVSDGSNVLLIKHAKKTPWHGQWILPGGELRQGELPEECAMREVKDETGVEIKVGKLAGAFVSDVSLRRKTDVWLLLLVYLAEPLSRDIKKKEGDVSEAAWFSLSEVAKLKVHEDCLNALSAVYTLPKEQTSLGEFLG